MRRLYVYVGLQLSILLFAADLEAGDARWAVRVNCGAEQDFVDKQGRTWLADKPKEGVFAFSGGGVAKRGEIAIKNTDTPELYRCERYAVEEYRFDLRNGDYTVRLHFAETSKSASEEEPRMFDVQIEGETVRDDFQPAREARGKFCAIVKEFPKVHLKDGTLNIGFDIETDSTLVNAIEVIRESPGSGEPLKGKPVGQLELKLTPTSNSLQICIENVGEEVAGGEAWYRKTSEKPWRKGSQLSACVTNAPPGTGLVSRALQVDIPGLDTDTDYEIEVRLIGCTGHEARGFSTTVSTLPLDGKKAPAKEGEHGVGARDDEKRDLQVLKGRLREALLGEWSEALEAEARGFMESLQADGSWGDISYRLPKRTGKQRPVHHLRRLVTMARAYRHPASKLHDSAELKKSMFSALDFWLVNDPRMPASGMDIIGQAGTLGSALILLEGAITEDQMKACANMAGRIIPGRGGANLAWAAENKIRHGCLVGNPGEVVEAFARIAEEIQICEQEASIQADFSLHQHGRQLNSGAYGMNFAVECSKAAFLAHGTRFALPAEKITLLSNYILDHQQWLVRDHTFDYNACGCFMADSGVERVAAGDLAGICERMVKLETERQKEFRALADRIEGKPGTSPLVGNWHFWRSDIMCHHRKGYYTSAKMTSERIVGAELQQGRLLKGQHLVDGVTYIFRTGDEYFGVFPVWDWKRIPGATIEQGEHLPRSSSTYVWGTTSFVGGVSDGMYGMAAFDFARGRLVDKVGGAGNAGGSAATDFTRGGLVAKKAWFYFDDEFVALGAGITCPTENPVFTSINQCRLKGEVVVSDRKGRRGLGKGKYQIERPSWVHHDGVGYVFPEETDVYLKAGAQIGSLGSITEGHSATEFGRQVFSLWLDHGRYPSDKTYNYIVVPAIEAKAMESYVAGLRVKVLKNAPELQAVEHKGLGMIQAAFYKAGELDAGDRLSIAVDKPCLLLFRQGEEDEIRLAVANPENRELRVNVGIRKSGKTLGVLFELPGGQNAGQSVVQIVKGGGR